MMGRINWRRVVLGGVVAGVVVNVLEGGLGFLMHSQWEAAMKNMKPPSGAVMAAHLVWSFVIGIAAIWLYAAVRPRYGPGPGDGPADRIRRLALRPRDFFLRGRLDGAPARPGRSPSPPRSPRLTSFT
jgi:hypothetical protein